MAGGDGGSQERKERHPVLRLRDAESADWRQEEEVEAQHSNYRARNRLGQSPLGCDE